MIIRKVAILGAGVMGAQIAAHLVNAFVPVLLFDLPAQGEDKNANVKKAIERLKKLSPSPFGINDFAQYITPANYQEDLARLSECDLVIEAIAENLEWKKALYHQIAPHLAPHAILASNTSGIPIAQLTEALPTELYNRFCGVHFFNPPRYMHLVELIPNAYTQAHLVDQLETFLTRNLGKGVVRAKDTPNFIANRVGTFGVLSAFANAQKYHIRFDELDDLTGVRLGRAKSATIRTTDIVGLDTLASVIKTMQTQLSLAEDPFASLYHVPDIVQKLISQGALGQKTKIGFYKKEGKAIYVIDPEKNEYVPADHKAEEFIKHILKKPAQERLALLRETDHPQAQFLWSLFRDTFHYIAVHLKDIAHSARDIDLAMRWGYGWSKGPFETWQSAGWQTIAKWMQEDIAAGKALVNVPLPEWVLKGPVFEHQGVYSAEGAWSALENKFVKKHPLPVYEAQLFPVTLFSESAPSPTQSGQTIFETDALRAWVHERYPQVLITSFKTKMNTMSPALLDGLNQAIDLAEKEYSSMVIWQPTSLKLGTPGGPFSAGANLQDAMPAYMMGGAKEFEPFVAKFQDTTMRIRYAQVPVVAAISGVALGGGCELLMHCAKRVAHLESYIGLVEVGVGLVPSGGGLKEIARRASLAAKRYHSDHDLLRFLKQGFEQAAMAKVSSSALEAKAMGYLCEDDVIVFNVFELLDRALYLAQSIAYEGYRAPLPTPIRVAGRSGIATIRAQIVNLKEGRFISKHDQLIATKIAEIICGGEVDDYSEVDETWLLSLERYAFIELLGTEKTQERIMTFLQDGRPVRN